MNPNKTLNEIRKKKPKITVIGESIEDHWYYGEITRQAAESPETGVFVMTGRVSQPGGAANMLESLRTILDIPLTECCFNTNLFDERAINHRYADEHTGKILFRREEPTTVTPFDPSLGSRDNIIISDYGRGLITWDALFELAEQDKDVIFSPNRWTCENAPVDAAERLNEWVWVMNGEENFIFKEATDCRCPDILIITRGMRPVGLYAGDFENPYVEFPIKPVEVPHTNGIGDVFLAAFSAAYFSDMSLSGSITFAIDCCHTVLESGRRGTHHLVAEDLEKFALERKEAI